MVTVEKAALATKANRQRSPNYPAVGLRNAVERVTKLYKADGLAGAPLESAIKHIGFSKGHGLAMSVLSALKKFGLVEEKNGRIVPTKLAVEIIQFPDGHDRRTAALKGAAVHPEIYRELVESYREFGRLPSDESLKPELVTDRGFNPKAVDGFIADFRDTLVFAGMLRDGALSLSIVSQVDGQSTAVIQNAPGILDEPRPVPLQGTKQDVFTLDEGKVVLQWPSILSRESYGDMKEWLQLALRKIGRSIADSDNSSSEH